MGWFIESEQGHGHEGYLVAIVDVAGVPRELAYDPQNTRETSVRRVSVACECGWRSPRLVAPLGTVHIPHCVCLPPHHADFEAACRELWREHVAEFAKLPRAIAARVLLDAR